MGGFRIFPQFFGKNARMESGTFLSAAEAAEYGEFKRTRREAEIAVSLHKLIMDASRRETDRHMLKSACDSVRKLYSYGVLVSPVSVAAAKRNLQDTEAYVVALVGGTGETLLPVKKYEAKKAVGQGARELRLILCYSALKAGNLGYLRREVRRVKRTARKLPLAVSLEDHSLSEDEVALGVRAACEGGADAVCVRGEVNLVLRALRVSAGKIRVDASNVENAEQMRALLKAGASLITTDCADRISEEMYRMAREEAGQIGTVVLPLPEHELQETDAPQ